MVQLNVSVRTQEHTFRPGLNPSEQTARWLSSQDSSAFSSGRVMRDTEKKRLLYGSLCQALYFNIICGTPIHPCVPKGSHKGGLGKLALGVGSKQQHQDCNSALLDSTLSCLVQLLFKSLFISLQYWLSILSSGSRGELPRNPMYSSSW